MKLTCEIIKPWLVPYSEGTLRILRPLLHAAVRRHLKACAACRQDEVLLHRTARALRRYNESTSWTLWRNRGSSPVDIPLSSRVLQAIRNEQPEPAPQRRRPRYPVPAYATAVVLLCGFFAFLTQPSIARPWFAQYFLTHRQVAKAAKPASVTPPYPMHDPFVRPADNTAVALAPRASAAAVTHRHKAEIRVASWVATGAPYHAGAARPRPVSLANPAVQAQEAMTTAEIAERNRPHAAPAPGSNMTPTSGTIRWSPGMDSPTNTASVPAIPDAIGPTAASNPAPPALTVQTTPAIPTAQAASTPLPAKATQGGTSAPSSPAPGQ